MFAREAFFEKVEATLGPYATCLPAPGHLRNTIGRPMPGQGRSVGPYATGLLMIWQLEFAIGRPTPSKGHWQMVLRLAMETLRFPFIREARVSG